MYHISYLLYTELATASGPLWATSSVLPANSPGLFKLSLSPGMTLYTFL